MLRHQPVFDRSDAFDFHLLVPLRLKAWIYSRSPGKGPLECRIEVAKFVTVFPHGVVLSRQKPPRRLIFRMCCLYLSML